MLSMIQARKMDYSGDEKAFCVFAKVNEQDDDENVRSHEKCGRRLVTRTKTYILLGYDMDIIARNK